ncbi:MAG TPA: indolepyruvate oxidoreductase subunit beta [Thermodesulfobacteriota bacterium]|nr:indolepyruvate oxidoreductase subunit beta [Thermodesulfobacteriota bacterium]
MKMDVVISGVGGQGNIFASVVISQYAMNKNLKVLGAETIGAAQRGGAVVSHIRISEGEIYSPLISRGQADLLIGMEYVEMLRHMRLLNPKGMYLLNAMKIPTVLNNMALDEYPEVKDIMKAVKKYCPNGHVIEASTLAKKLGNIQMTNVVMLGALVKAMPFFEYNEMKWLVSSNSPTRFKEANVKGFEEGYKLIN